MALAAALWQGVRHLFHLTLFTHQLPYWFLVGALFLPRVALALAWFLRVLALFQLRGWIPLAIGVLLPRLLVLYLIFLDQEISLWFLMHLGVAALVLMGGGGTYRRRREWKRGERL